MINRIKKILLVFFLLTSYFSFLPSKVSAQTKTWSGVCVASNIKGAGDVATLQGVQCLIGNILSVFITFIGLAGFVMLIFASFKLMLSSSNSKGMESARNTITYAIVGLVVALSSYFILNIIAEFTGVDKILNFTIPGSDTNWADIL